MEKAPKKILLVDSIHPLFTTEMERSGFECVDGTALGKEEILNDISPYQGIVIRSRFKIDKDFIDRAKGIKFIARAGSGMENIDVAYALKKGIKCISAPEGNKDAVGEHAIGMLLSLFNNLNRADAEVRKGVWKREENRGHEMMYKTVGIIGYGNTGSAFANRLLGFNVMAMAYDKYKQIYQDDAIIETNLETIFEEAEVVSIHLPLTEETEYLVNEDFLNKFQNPIYLINTSRGKIVDTQALVNAIESGMVLGACLDVLEYEKSSLENLESDDLPAAFKYLCESDKVILSPHVAGWSFESNERIAHILADRILDLY